MTETEKIVRIFHESWDMRDPDRGATVIAEDCQFEDIARGEKQIGPDSPLSAGRHHGRWTGESAGHGHASGRSTVTSASSVFGDRLSSVSRTRSSPILLK